MEITQDNLYLILPSKVSWLADMLAKDKDISIVDAMKEVYSSAVYRLLEDEASKTWHLGPIALYEELTNS